MSSIEELTVAEPGRRAKRLAMLSRKRCEPKTVHEYGGVSFVCVESSATVHTDDTFQCDKTCVFHPCRFIPGGKGGRHVACGSTTGIKFSYVSDTVVGILMRNPTNGYTLIEFEE